MVFHHRAPPTPIVVIAIKLAQWQTGLECALLVATMSFTTIGGPSTYELRTAIATVGNISLVIIHGLTGPQPSSITRMILSYEGYVPKISHVGIMLCSSCQGSLGMGIPNKLGHHGVISD